MGNSERTFDQDPQKQSRRAEGFCSDDDMSGMGDCDHLGGGKEGGGACPVEGEGESFISWAQSYISL